MKFFFFCSGRHGSENLCVLVRTDKDEEYKLLDVRWKKKDGCPAHGCFKAGAVLVCIVALHKCHLCCSCVIPRQLCCNYYILHRCNAFGRL